MRKLLFWGAHDLVETFPRVEILMKNRINNSGNLLFCSGVARAVITGDVVLEHFLRKDVEKLIGSMEAGNADRDGVLTPLEMRSGRTMRPSCGCCRALCARRSCPAG